MAPRKTKVGRRRIDAAIDALSPLGFSKDTIRKSIKGLLKVYEGDAGWVFIEEASYKLVIDTILEDQEKNQADEEGEASRELHALEISEHVLEVGDMESHHSQHEVSAALVYSGEMEAQPDVNSDGGAIIIQQNDEPTVTSDSSTIILQQYREPPRQRRPPCYGWISETESEDDEDCI